MNKFRKIARFKYKNKRYQLFMSESNKVAFLEIKDGKFFYPELEELLEINYLFNYNRHSQNIKNDKIKYFSFIPKAIRYGALITLTSALLTGCGSKATFTLEDLPSYQRAYMDVSSEADENNYSIEDEKENSDLNNIVNDSNNSSAENSNSNSSNSSNNTSENYPYSADNDYLALLATADDEIDYRYASDYENLQYVKRLFVRDSKAYDEIYGYNNVSFDQIESALNSNAKINSDYKKFILQYVNDWNRLYPGSDFSTLYHNLSTLEIRVCTKDEMARYTLSTSSVACYKRSENIIYVLDGIDLSRESSDYIVVAHELTHCARNSVFENEDGYTVDVSFYDDTKMGLYIEEALITDFCYELQGLGNKSNFYTLQSSYFRIILDAIDYNGADFMNHSVNYLIDKMDEYMGDEQYAYHIITLIDAEASLRYTPYIEPEFEDFSELYQYITRMYIKNNVTSDMSYEEAMTKYDDLEAELTYYFDQMKNPIELDLSIFKEEFEAEISNLGIVNTNGISR